MNAVNYNCTDSANCDQYLSNEGTGFSGASNAVVLLSATQEKATPDQPTSLSLDTITQTSATFYWTPPM